MSKNPFSVPPMEGGGGGGVSATGGTALADNVIVRGDGTTGIQGSDVTIADAGGGIVKMSVSGNALDIGTSTSNNLRFLANNTAYWAVSYITGHFVEAQSADIGIGRSAAGVLKVTDGSTGFGTVHSDHVWVKQLLRVNDSATNPPSTDANNPQVTIGNAAGGIGIANGKQIKFSTNNNAENALATGLGLSAAGVLKVTDGSTGLGRIVDLGSESCLGVLTGADFNVTTDQAITIAATTYIVTGIIVTNASISLDTAAGGVYTAASKGGTAVVAAAQVYSALTASTKYLSLTLEAVAGTDVFSATTLYLSLTSAQGAAATADVYVLGRRLS